jgi:hypothetical protein
MLLEPFPDLEPEPEPEPFPDLPPTCSGHSTMYSTSDFPDLEPEPEPFPDLEPGAGAGVGPGAFVSFGILGAGAGTLAPLPDLPEPEPPLPDLEAPPCSMHIYSMHSSSQNTMRGSLSTPFATLPDLAEPLPDLAEPFPDLAEPFPDLAVPLKEKEPVPLPDLPLCRSLYLLGGGGV